MLTYNNSEVIQCLRQYDMFANSLNLVRSNDERNMIVKQLTKLEEKIISLTNSMYEEEYYALANKECDLLEEEKNRITELVELINQRLSYVEKRCNNHYQLTGDSIDVKDVLGASQLDELENKARVIDKYNQNVKLEAELENDIQSLTNKISLASEKIDINKSLNVELETTFKKVLDDAFSRLGLYEMLDAKDDIEYVYYDTEKALTMAQSNYEMARATRPDMLAECQEMLRDISNDYEKYKDQVNILKLMTMYNSDVTDYEELLNKRKEVNDILNGIKNQEFLELVSEMITKQFSTIMMEEQDINTFNDLALEKERKQEKLSEIRDENNSEEFQTLLSDLLENERKRQEKILEEQRKIEEEEKRKKQEIEKKKQEEILKKQKIIEEARKKDIEKRTKQLLEEQQNSVLQAKKKENKVSFETIKDVSLDESKLDEIEPEEIKEEVKEEINEEPKEETNEEVKTERILKLNLKDLDEKESPKKEEIEEDEPVPKNKVDIEKELFEEFNNKKNDDIRIDDEVKDENEILLFDDKVDDFNIDDAEFAKLKLDDIDDEKNDDVDDKLSNNQFPDMSIDEYMKNFDETKIDKSSTLSDFGDDFPSIPI